MNIDLARKFLLTPESINIDKSLELLGQEGKLTDLQAMLVYVKNADPKLAKIAVVSCSNLIRNNLIAHFGELDPKVRQKLGVMMETLVPQIIDEIAKDLWCEDDDRRLRALQILGLLKKNPTIRDILAKLIKDKDEKIRATAVNLMAKVIESHEHDLIMSLLSDKDKRVRANTVESLERLGNKRLVPILLRFRKDPVNRIRGNVLKALYTLGMTDIIEDLSAMLSSQDQFMKASGLWVVAQLKLSIRKVEDLTGRCYMSDNAMVFANAKKALEAINSPRSLGFIRYLPVNAIISSKP